MPETGRTLLKSDKKAWYHVVTADGVSDKKVRAKDDDNIFDTLPEAQEAAAALQSAHRGSNGDQAEAKTKAAKSRPAKEREPAQSTVAPTGKILVGKTVEIRCQWKEGGKRCPNTRVVKPQDVFQVKFCVEHQKKARQRRVSELRKAKTAARRAEREKAKAKAAA